MAIFFTILTGVIVYVLGQLVLKLIIEPIHGYKTVIGEISMALINYAKDYANPGVGTQESMDKASDNVRLLASKLSAQISLIPCYDKTSKVFFLPLKEEIYEAKTNLIGISNGIHQKDLGTRETSLGEINVRRAEKICDLLGIYVPDNEKLYKNESSDA